MRQLNLALDYLSKRTVAARLAEWEASGQNASPNGTPVKDSSGGRPPHDGAYADRYREPASSPWCGDVARSFGTLLSRWIMAILQRTAASTLLVIGWSIGLLVRVVALAAASYGWFQLDSWAFAQHPWGWPWWIGMVSAPVGCILLLRGALPFVLHGWSAMIRHLGWD
ncbi:hypothetical protein ACSSZE_18445 [Acidithiobacillus caldus]